MVVSLYQPLILMGRYPTITGKTISIVLFRMSNRHIIFIINSMVGNRHPDHQIVDLFNIDGQQIVSYD